MHLDMCAYPCMCTQCFCINNIRLLFKHFPREQSLNKKMNNIIIEDKMSQQQTVHFRKIHIYLYKKNDSAIVPSHAFFFSPVTT